MVLIEQNVERGLSLADRVFVLEKGGYRTVRCPR